MIDYQTTFSNSRFCNRNSFRLASLHRYIIIIRSLNMQSNMMFWYCYIILKYSKIFFNCNHSCLASKANIRIDIWSRILWFVRKISSIFSVPHTVKICALSRFQVIYEFNFYMGHSLIFRQNFQKLVNYWNWDIGWMICTNHGLCNWLNIAALIFSRELMNFHCT